jgi:hypothetical protein
MLTPRCPRPLVTLALSCALLMAASTAAATERSRKAAPSEAPAKEPPTTPAPKRADLAVESVTLSSASINRRATKVRVQVRNVGELTAKSTGLIVECFLLEGEKKRRPCPGSNPPARLYVPGLTVGAARNFEVPLSRFLLPVGQPGHYEIKALLDTRGKVIENNEYNNSGVLRFQY